MAGYKRYAKKAYTNIKKRAVKRYGTKSGGVKLQQVARDVAKIQRSLNVEHKHIDFSFGSASNNGQRPTKNTPIIIPLPTPVKGTGYNNRIGNQIRVVHMTSKLEFTFQNNTDLISRTTCKAQILFAKSADDIPDITKLYELDPNGHYTPLSMANTQEWNKYKWVKPLGMMVKNTQYTNRYPESNSAGTARINGASSSQTFQVDEVANQPLNIVAKYRSASTKCSTRISFKNNSEDVEQYKPYLLLRSDVIESSTGSDYDPVVVSGTVRMTYVDN